MKSSKTAVCIVISWSKVFSNDVCLSVCWLVMLQATCISALIIRQCVCGSVCLSLCPQQGMCYRQRPQYVWLNGLVVSALGIELGDPASIPGSCHYWVATLGKLFIHIASPVSQLQETGVRKGVFGA